MGQIVMNTHDYADDPKPWVESMHRIAKEVVPHVKDVVAAAQAPLEVAAGLCCDRHRPGRPPGGSTPRNL